MRFVFLGIVALAMSAPAFSQAIFKPGYVIKNNGDSVRGFIEEGNESKMSAIVSFKKDANASPVQDFQLADLTGFGFDGGNLFKKLSYADADNKRSERFAKYLLKGYYSLYGFIEADRRFFVIKTQQDSTYLLYDDKYTLTGSDVQVGNYKNVLVFIAGANCGKLKDEAQQVDFNEKTLIDFVKKVNSCVAPSEPTDVLYKAPKMETHFYGYAGGLAVGSKHELAGRIIARFTLPSVDRKTSLNLGVNFMQHFESKDVYIPYAGNYNGDKTNEKVTTNYISFTGTLNYYFTNGKVRPYFNAGFSYSIENQSGELNSFRKPTKHNSNGVTYVAAAGIDVNLTPSLFIEAEWRQESIRHLPTIGIAYLFK